MTTCIVIAGHLEVMNFMLSKCTVEVDARNALGFTPLMKAALQGRTKCAKILLLAGKRSPNQSKEVLSSFNTTALSPNSCLQTAIPEDPVNIMCIKTTGRGLPASIFLTYRRHIL
jgi:ankyrin repeat protein